MENGNRTMLTGRASSLCLRQTAPRAFAGLVLSFFSLAAPGPAQLTTTGNQRFQQGAAGILGNYEGNDRFAHALSGCDFNGDGFDDLAVGSPGESGARGIVNVIYSDGNGLTPAGNQKWEQGVDGIDGNAEGGDQFGIALTAGDFDADGYCDLAAGANGEDNSRGIVHVLYGSEQGLTADGNQAWRQGHDGLRGDAESGDFFGTALDTGDFNGDGFDDLAVGAPGENNNGGMVSIVFGSSRGLVANGNQRWRQGDDGLRGDTENNDLFAAALAAGDYNGDGYDDLVAGTPGENGGRGTVNMILGSSGGLISNGNRRFEQDNDGLPDDREGGDGFGGVIEAGDFNGDGYDDLAVASLGENGGEGNVIVIPGARQALTGAGSRRWRQDQDGLPDRREGGDRFGSELVSGDFNGDRYDDLAVGVRGEDGNRGLLHVLPGSSRGLTGNGNQVFAQGASGLSDQAETGDDFTFAMAAGDFGGEAGDDLAVGAPGEDNDRGIAHVLFGDAIPRPHIAAIVGAGSGAPPVTNASYNAILTLWGTEFILDGAPAADSAGVGQGPPTNSNGVCVEMDGSRAPIFAAFAQQINVQAALQPGRTSAAVRVLANCDRADEIDSDAFELPVAPSSPQFFFFISSPDGRGPIAAVNAITGTFVGAAGLLPGAGFAPAAPGDVITVFMTGLGATEPLLQPGQLAGGPAAATLPVAVSVGGAGADLFYAGVTPGFAGLYQVNFQVPGELAAGDAPVSVTVGGAAAPAGGFLTLQAPPEASAAPQGGVLQ